MNNEFKQSVIEWGKSAIRKAALGESDSMHLDMFSCNSYCPDTAIDDSFLLMDCLIEHFSQDVALNEVVIVTAVALSCKDKMSFEVPAVLSLKEEWDGITPPEIYFVPRIDINIFCDGEEYSSPVEIITPLSEKYERKNLFSFYKCWRGRRAIDKGWDEYERCIFRYFDRSGKLLWLS